MLGGGRSAGVLAHLTSIPGPPDHGDLGRGAHAFVDWSSRAGQSWWQMLPVVPPGYGDSPYDSPSAFAGSPWLISLDLLAEDGLLRRDELRRPSRRLDPVELRQFRWSRLCLASDRASGPEFTAELHAFRERSRSWLGDYALYCALKEAHQGKSWVDWDVSVRKRKPAALERARRELAPSVTRHERVQLFFDRQWQALRVHAQARGVRLLGDVPMFVGHDSADVWANPSQFFLDSSGRPTVVAGVPPDAFSDDGQLWGNPLFRWKRMQADGFQWWLERLRVTLSRFDALRLDHFIGLRRYWEVPQGAKTAKEGRFVRVPGEAFLDAARSALGGLPFLAEDLGVVTDEVTALRRAFGLPGMKVLQFAFSDPAGSDYLPHRFERDTVVYTGTHDNDTSVGWFRNLSSHKAERARVLAYLGTGPKDIHMSLIRLAYASVAQLAVVPLQDMLGEGSRARMNTPGTSAGNWSYRAQPTNLSAKRADALRTLAETYERSAPRAR